MAVYVCGANKVGQLGIGTYEDALDPSVVELIKGKRISHVAAGEQHSLALTEFGDVFMWGRGKEGQLGQGERKNSPVPVMVTALKHERVVRADCGSYHTIVTTDTGRCFTWGKLHHFTDSASKAYFGGFSTSGKHHQPEERMQKMIDKSMQAYLAGNYNLDEEEVTNNQFGNFVSTLQPLPLLVEPLSRKRIVEVAAGYAFSIAISDKGEAYSWGFNEKGQLGHGHRFNIEIPKRMEALAMKHVIKASCGQEHAAVLTQDKEVYTFGLGVFGQLGHGDLFDQLIPKRIELFAQQQLDIIEVSCGSYYTCARTNDGQAFSWGHSEYSQMGGVANHEDWGTGKASVGAKEALHYHAIPRLLQGFEGAKIRKITCGHLHSVVVTENDEVFSFGWGPSGCLGHGDRRFQLVPKQITSLRGEQISTAACGWKHTLIVKAGSNTTFAFDFKQLVDSKMYSDITFDIEGKHLVHAHKAIVFARCPTLAKMLLFQSRFVTGAERSNVLKISGVRYLVFLGFLRYLYTDHLKVAPHLIFDLGNFARQYGVVRLAEICKRHRMREEGTELVIPPSQFAADMSVLIGNDIYSDVTFLVQGERIPAHKALLNKRCSYFERLFESDFKEKQQREFLIDDSISPAIFLCVLRYLYTGDECITPDNAIELLQAADRFMMEDLKAVVEAYIESSIELDNTCALLDIADGVSAYRLKRVCLELMCESSKENWESIRSSTGFTDLRRSAPHLLREIDYRASKNNLTRPGEVIRSGSVGIPV